MLTELKAYFDIRNIESATKIERCPPPQYTSSWSDCSAVIIAHHADEGCLEDLIYNVGEFTGLTELIAENDPGFFNNTDIKELLSNILEALVKLGRSDYDYQTAKTVIDDLQGQVDYLDTVRICYGRLVKCFRTHEEVHNSLTQIRDDYDCLHDELVRELPPEPEYDADEDIFRDSGGGCDSTIEAMFRDL